jgi:hypothetical protein
MAREGVRIAHVDDIPAVPGQSYIEGAWKPVRADLGIDAFGTNAYVADAGQLIVEEHDELNSDDPGASHRELYIVLRGRAEFTLAGERVDARAGTLVYVHDPAIVRSAVALEDGTVVLAVGAPAGRAFEPSDWETGWTASRGPTG